MTVPRAPGSAKVKTATLGTGLGGDRRTASAFPTVGTKTNGLSTVGATRDRETAVGVRVRALTTVTAKLALIGRYATPVGTVFVPNDSVG